MVVRKSRRVKKQTALVQPAARLANLPGELRHYPGLKLSMNAVGENIHGSALGIVDELIIEGERHARRYPRPASHAASATVLASPTGRKRQRAAPFCGHAVREAPGDARIVEGTGIDERPVQEIGFRAVRVFDFGRLPPSVSRRRVDGLAHEIALNPRVKGSRSRACRIRHRNAVGLREYRRIDSKNRV